MRTVALPATSTTTLRAPRANTRGPAAVAAVTPPKPEASAPAPAEVLRRAEGIELIGRYEDSGFRTAPLIARRADGQVVQLTELLYAVAEAADGRRDLHAVAHHVSDHCGRSISADNVAFIAERKLRPLGVLALPDGSTPELTKREPLVALRHRRPLLSERTVNAGARMLTWLHVPVVVAVVLVALVTFDVWLFASHGIAGGLRQVLYEPLLLLAVFGSVVVATAFHEFGHASACRYGGARPGVMGAGIYLVWPAFYCDVTDAYRLGRRGRLRTDLGGVYFNGICALVCGGLYAVTGAEAALFAAFLLQVLALQQLLPLMRFDGYYVLTDLTGVPDILSRIKPIFRSLVPGREPEPRVTELKPWVRFAVTAYLVTLVPLLAFLFILMLLALPRILTTAYDSASLQVDDLRNGPGPAEAAADVLRLALLGLQAAAIALSVSRVARLAGRGLSGWSSGSAPRTVVAAAIAVAVIGGLAYTWWPNGDYEPIQPGERGTIGEAVSALPAAAEGRPSFTREQELQYAPAPPEPERPAAEQRGGGADERGGPERASGSGEPDERREELDTDLSDLDGPSGDDPDDSDGTGGSSTTTAPSAPAAAPTTDSSSSPTTTTDPAPATSGTTTTSTTPATTTESATEPAPTTDTAPSTTETTPAEPTTTTDTTTTPTTTEPAATESTTAPTTTETPTTTTTPSG